MTTRSGPGRGPSAAACTAARLLRWHRLARGASRQRHHPMPQSNELLHVAELLTSRPPKGGVLRSGGLSRSVRTSLRSRRADTLFLRHEEGAPQRVFVVAPAARADVRGGFQVHTGAGVEVVYEVNKQGLERLGPLRRAVLDLPLMREQGVRDS